MGDPNFCKQCNSALNINSKLISKPNELKRIWPCEFCETINEIQLEQEEIPKSDDCIYMLQSKQQMANEESEISVIFCVDISGSMSVTSQVENNPILKEKLIKKQIAQLESMKQFMEQHEYNMVLQQQKNMPLFISRKDCVFTALEQQLEIFRQDYPNRKIGIVAFGDDVTLVGDGMQNPITIAGEKLSNAQTCIEIGQKAFKTHMTQVAKDNMKLASSISNLNENGKTALGPGLAAALGLASQGKKGSMVILCTDGLANIGVGALDQDPEAKFYEEMIKFSLENGISISTITMKGEECNVKVLGRLSEQTKGKVTRVNPQTIASDFANAISDPPIATDVNVRIQLHKGLQFTDEPAQYLKNQGSIWEKLIGNVTKKSQISFQYDLKQIKASEDLENLKKLKEFPFQAQIRYTSLEGHRMIRIISRIQTIDHDQEKVKKDAKINILARHAKVQQAQLLLEGNIEKAQLQNEQWDNLISNEIGGEKTMEWKTNKQEIDTVISKKQQINEQKKNKNSKEENKNQHEEMEDDVDQANYDLFE